MLVSMWTNEIVPIPSLPISSLKLHFLLKSCSLISINITKPSPFVPIYFVGYNCDLIKIVLFNVKLVSPIHLVNILLVCLLVCVLVLKYELNLIAFCICAVLPLRLE